MTSPAKSRILIVDDEEAILETMKYTFEDEYEVHTSNGGERALRIFEEDGPFAAVVTDQRMPGMTGVEFLARVYERYPNTMRIILTGFADMDAVVKAINDGHAYAYIAKPWEPAHLRQVVRRAVEHHQLEIEHTRLLSDLRTANRFVEAVMDRLDVGAIAVDAAGIVRQTNQLARRYLGLDEDPRGRSLKGVLEGECLETLGEAAMRIAADPESRTQELDITCKGCVLRLRLGVETLLDPDGAELGGVLLLREISHEPMRRCVDELLARLGGDSGGLRDEMEKTMVELRALAEPAERVESPGMSELGERTSRALTALENWLAVDDTIAREEFPDAQLLRDRMRIAAQRWPLPERLPGRVRLLAERVEGYYESGENRRERVL
jgi:CheY-like chemotaxis protein